MFIIIGADIVPTKSNEELFKNGDVDGLVGKELKNILETAAYRIFNLEVPLTDVEKPIIKEGPNLIASRKTVVGYKAIGVDLLTLANNHILDQDVQGLISTETVLDEYGISHLGTGKNLSEAYKPFIFSFLEKKVGIYSCVEHEFSVATEEKPGANPFDPLCSFDHIAELKEQVDYLIVLYHGGKEHYRYPSPMLQKICRKFVDKGADLVICQHSHCIGCEEKYNAKTIVYGQGNFIFDDCNDDCWQTSILVKIDAKMNVSYIPLVKTGKSVRMADEHNAKEIMTSFYARSEEIRNPDFINEKYKEFAETFSDFYLRALLGRRSMCFRIINKLSKGTYMKRYLRRTYGLTSKVKIANYIDCEAHRELMSQAMANEYERVT